MHIIVALLAILGGAWFWYVRARAGVDAARELTGVASDVMAAARRFGFRRRYNEHPVDSLQDAKVVVAGAGLAFLELADLPTAEDRDRLLVALQHRLDLSEADAREGLILGRWLINESGGAQPGLDRLSRRLRKMNGPAALEPLMAVLNDTASASGGLNDRQRDALDGIARAFRLG
jgi:hypothetical protein